jgi:hypothetical protein
LVVAVERLLLSNCAEQLNTMPARVPSREWLELKVA